MSGIILTMSSPPSLNALWITIPGKKRVRSPAYNEWLTTAGWEVKRQWMGMRPIACRYNLTLHVPISRRDSGNWEKAISDLLEAVGVVTNDGNAHSITVTPSARTDCVVEIVELPDMGGIRKRPPVKLPWQSARKRATRPSQAALAAFRRAGGLA